MTYRELSKELGISSSKLMSLEGEGVLRSRGAAALLGNIDDEDVRNIRLCCLFSMLGIPDSEAASIVKGEIDLRAALKRHVDEILSDDSNYSQAAIVMQNIRRECNDITEMDPVPFLQHIKELKHSGGLFYDVNTSRLETGKKNQNQEDDREQQRQGWAETFSQKFAGYTAKYWKNANDEDTTSEDTTGEDAAAKDVTAENTTAENTTAESAAESTDTDNSQSSNRGPELYDSTESTKKQSSGYDDNWSPYTDRGFGASNMGAGNWHGWTPGYGTYSTQVGARARINNGEKTCPHPFRRFAARALDTTVVTLIVGTILKLGFRVNIGVSLSMVAYIEIIFWMFELMIEPLLLTTIGTTPGKWIMGIIVKDMKTKEKLELKQAYIRSLKLAWHGFGFMIPIFTVFRRVMSFVRCKVNDTMPWDEGIDVELKDEGIPRIVLCILALIILNVGDEIVSKQALIPKNRGNITYEQFYENVVEIMKYTGYAGDIPDFVVESRNGYVNSVKLVYTSEQTNVSRYDEMYIGFLAFAGAAEDSNGIKMMLSSTLGQMKSYYASFTDSYCGVKVSNSSDSQIKDGNSYSLLLSMLYGSEVSIPGFNQTFVMTK